MHGSTVMRVRMGMVGVGMMVATAVGCSGWLARSEGLDPATLPENIRGDYAVFAERCSKCHSLARPLSSGIDDDDYWAMYVARMRRQPASGISQEDTVVVLRFLHYFSEDMKAKKAKHEAPSLPASSASPAAPLSPAPAPLPSRSSGITWHSSSPPGPASGAAGGAG
jgi:hypothetical protein